MAHIRQSRPDSGAYKTVKARVWRIYDSQGQSLANIRQPRPDLAHIRQSGPDSGRDCRGKMLQEKGGLEGGCREQVRNRGTSLIRTPPPP